MSERDPESRFGEDVSEPGVNGWGWEPSEEEIDRTFRARAEELAKPLDARDAAVERIDVLVFAASGERYGIEAAHVADVGRIGHLTPLPGAPSFIRGIISHRGQVLPLYDLRTLLDLSDDAPVQSAYAIAIEVEGMALGVAAEAIEGVRSIPTSDLHSGAEAGLHHPWLLGVTGDRVVILRVDLLARDPRILVNDPAA